MANLILVKHALPEIIPTVPAHRWHLSGIGRLRCKVLAERLACYAPDCIVSSTEPKAVETARIVADHLRLTSHVVEGLHEHDRSTIAWESREHFEAQVDEFFKHPHSLVMGNETAAQAYERFAQAVAAVINEHLNRNIVIVAHGTVITLLVAHATGGEPFDLWKRLGLPSFVVLSLPEIELVTVVETMD